MATQFTRLLKDFTCPVEGNAATIELGGPVIEDGSRVLLQTPDGNAGMNEYEGTLSHVSEHGVSWQAVWHTEHIRHADNIRTAVQNTVILALS